MIDHINDIVEIESFNDYVYDVEIPRNHMFFANDILVHNTDSMFLHIEPILEAIHGDNYKNITDREKIDSTIDVVKDCAEYINDDALQRLIQLHDPDFENSLAKEFDFNFKEELVLRKLLYMTKKKKYASWIINKEGTDVDQIDITGIEIVRSDYSPFAKKVLKDVIDKILKMDYGKFDLIPYVNEKIDECIELANKGDISVGTPGAWGLREYKKYTYIINSMVIYNTLFENEFGRGSRGYTFYVDSINTEKIPNYENKYRKLVDRDIIKEDEGIKYISIPFGKKLDTSIFTPNIEKILELNIYNRLGPILDTLDISIDNMYSLEW